jgi:hypothetical protein
MNAPPRNAIGLDDQVRDRGRRLLGLRDRPGEQADGHERERPAATTGIPARPSR